MSERIEAPAEYTRKQMGDACEMLVAAELTLAGVPALKVPDNWPGYDVVAQRNGADEPLRISVKSRTYKKGAAFVVFREYRHDARRGLGSDVNPQGADV